MIKMLGAALLTAGCGGFGFSLAAAHRREIAMLRCLLRAVQEMQWELKYRMTELPDLCCIAANAAGGTLRTLFLELAGKLKRQEVEDISGCFNGIISRQELPRCIRKNLRQLGSSLGRFDLEGQLQGLEAVCQQCRQDLRGLEENSIQRIRSYQTLALCAGAALAIIFI